MTGRMIVQMIDAAIRLVGCLALLVGLLWLVENDSASNSAAQDRTSNFSNLLKEISAEAGQSLSFGIYFVEPLLDNAALHFPNDEITISEIGDDYICFRQSGGGGTPAFDCTPLVNIVRISWVG